MTDITIDAMNSNIAQYVFKQDLAFLNDVAEASEKLVLLIYDEDKDTYSEPVFMEEWGDDLITDDILIYKVQEIVEQIPEIWAIVEALNNQ